MPPLTEFMIPAGGEASLANPEGVLGGGPGTSPALKAELLTALTSDLMAHVLRPLFWPANCALDTSASGFGLPSGLNVLLIPIKVEVADIGVNKVVLHPGNQSSLVTGSPDRIGVVAVPRRSFLSRLISLSVAFPVLFSEAPA